MADVGCSYPVFLEEAARPGCVQAVCVDWDLKAARYGEQVGVRVLTPDACVVEVEDGSLDVLRFSHALEHMIDPLDALQRHAVKLRSGGLLYITQPNFPALNARATDASIKDSGWPSHLHFFSCTSLVAMVRRAGLVVETFFTHHQPEDAAAAFGASMDVMHTVDTLRFLHGCGEPSRGPLANYPIYAGENSTLFARRL